MAESKGSILIVDDDTESLLLLSGILTDEGYHVRAADSGHLAHAAIESTLPDLVLADMRMPGMDGIELLRKLKVHPKASEVPFMFISGSSGTTSRVEGLRLGAVDFVTKPYQRDELLARIRTHLELARLRFRLEEQVERRTHQFASTVQLLQREIEERSRSERAMRESEARFRSMADTAPVMIVTTDAVQQAMFFNRAWQEFTGRDPQRDLGFGWIDAIHPDEIGVVSTISESFAARSICTLEYRLRRADGEYRTVLCKGVPRYEDDGTFVGYIATLVDIADLKEYQTKLRALSASLISVQEEERRRISRELHDDLVQRLALISIDLGTLLARVPKDDWALVADLRDVQQRTVQTAELTRHIAHELHPLILDDLGIVAALRSLCHESARMDEIRIDFESSGLPSALNREVASCIYSVTKEALSNVSKHARATQVGVSLVGKDRRILLQITDDGVGFNASATESVVGLGIVNMRERVRWANGTFSITAKRQEGTQIVVEVPGGGSNAEARAHTVG